MRGDVNFSSHAEKIVVFARRRFGNGQASDNLSVHRHNQIGRKIIVVVPVRHGNLIETDETEEKTFARLMGIRLRVVIVGESQLIRCIERKNEAVVTEVVLAVYVVLESVIPLKDAADRTIEWKNFVADFVDRNVWGR